MVNAGAFVQSCEASRPDWPAALSLEDTYWQMGILNPRNFVSSNATHTGAQSID